MTLEELVGDDARTAREALRLVELNIQDSDISRNIQSLEIKEPVELIKGMCSMVALLSSVMNKGDSPAPLFKAVRASTERAAEEGHDMSANLIVLNILDALQGNGGSFYLQVYSLPNPEQTLLGLVTLFQSLSLDGIGKDVEEVTEKMSHILETTF